MKTTITQKKGRIGIMLATAAIVVSLVFTCHCLAEADGFTIVIDVAPNVLNLQSKGQVVTVHTNIAYYLVSGASVELNGVEINYWKSDNRGQFVAKFVLNDVKDLPLAIGEYNALILKGITVSGESFEGSQEIMVISNVPRK
jgi:hypothetical protein